jgi:ring-1,2-phenylacetyl-CoA epoxidase subunit PaaB
VSDTQWPRFEVFEQERPDQPHRNSGAVHAPDAEMALQNARDVFVRRPECYSLWVAPADQILSRTAEEVQSLDLQRSSGLAGGASETYLIFQKQTQRQGETFVRHAGEVEAASAQAALVRALERFAGEPVYVWWVVPARAITRSDPADAEPLFAPARDKPFRLPRSYHVQSQMRAVKAAPGAAEAASAGEQEPTA